jgi:hypothetical protein
VSLEKDHAAKKQVASSIKPEMALSNQPIPPRHRSALLSESRQLLDIEISRQPHAVIKRYMQARRRLVLPWVAVTLGTATTNV